MGRWRGESWTQSRARALMAEELELSELRVGLVWR